MTFIRDTLKTIVPDTSAASKYKDRQYKGTDEEYRKDIAGSCTLYVGNLSFYTSEEQIYDFFGKVAPVKRLVMGLDRANKTPCGFCFIEYYRHEDAAVCKKYLNGMRLDERFIRVDYDYGFSDGRQFGRGKSGGQVRDEYRTEYDEGRGGWGSSVNEAGTSNAKRARTTSSKESNPRFRERDD